MARKMPAQYKACEGCRHFQALYYGGEAECDHYGMIKNGVVWCRQYEEEDDAVDNLRNSDGDSVSDHGD